MPPPLTVSAASHHGEGKEPKKEGSSQWRNIEKPDVAYKHKARKKKLLQPCSLRKKGGAYRPDIFSPRLLVRLGFSPVLVFSPPPPLKSIRGLGAKGSGGDGDLRFPRSLRAAKSRKSRN